MKIKLLGSSTETVTGSCSLVTTKDGINILLDCGTKQTGNTLKDYKYNTSDFDFKVRDIDYIVNCEIHQDHSGRIPLLYARGFKGKLIIPKGSKHLLKIMLLDAVFIMNKTYKYLSKNHKVKLPYTEDDVENTMSNVLEVDFNSAFQLSKNLTMEFFQSGHIINSAQVLIKDHSKTLLYTSDIGNISQPRVYTKEIQLMQNADLIVSESTYAERNRCSDIVNRESDKSVLEAIIRANKGTIIIPVFALHRLQTIMNMLYEIKPSIPILIDSPLGIKTTNEFSRILSDVDYDKMIMWENFKYVEDWEESQALIKDGKSKIVLTSGGFCEAGRIINWLQYCLSNNENHICFVGYSGDNGIANSIRRKDKVCNIYGMEVDNKIQVHELKSFSSHMQRQDLLNYLSSTNCQKIILHHGSKQAKIDLKEDLDKLLYEKCKSTKVIIAEKGLEIEI